MLVGQLHVGRENLSSSRDLNLIARQTLLPIEPLELWNWSGGYNIPIDTIDSQART